MMMRHFNFKKGILLFSFIVASCSLFSQVPNPALVGYFHNWQDANAPYLQLDVVDPRYSIIDVAFAVPQPGTDYDMQFVPDQVSQAAFIVQIQSLHAQGRKVLISIGGATAPVSLDNITERDAFIASMNAIINTYGFDGIDIDLEGSSISVTGGTIAVPVDQPVINMIYAVKQIMSDFYVQNNRRLILTMAPETAYVQGGLSAYGGIWGAYLPLIDALRDSLEILHVQLYNSGSMFGLDGFVYSQGTADFIVAMCETVIQGFNTAGGLFNGLPAGKVAVGLPACPMAAGGGYTDTATVKSAIDYLMGNGPKPGNYTLIQPGGYPTLRGMMTWSINWDAVPSCNGANEFAESFENIFGTPTSLVNISNTVKNTLNIYPNPVKDKITLEVNEKSGNMNVSIYNTTGQQIIYKKLLQSKTQIDITGLQKGLYFVKYADEKTVEVKRFIKN